MSTLNLVFIKLLEWCKKLANQLYLFNIQNLIVNLIFKI